MLRNYLLIAFRSLIKNLGYTSINVFGLAIGLACCLLVVLYVQFELSYESFHEKKSQLYRYVPRGEREGVIRMQTMVPAGFGPLVKDAFHEVAMFTRYSGVSDRPLFKVGDTTLPAQALSVADPDFFQMFSYQLVEGNAASVFARPNSIVIAKSIADQFFPNGNAMGQVIRYDNRYDYEITGVFADLPSNTHLSFSYLTTFETIAKMVQDQYGTPAQDFLTDLGAWNYSTYFYIPEQGDISSLAKRIDQKFTEVRGDKYNPESLGDWLQPLEEIHFTKGIVGDSANGNMASIYIFSSVALLILVIACFNFMNLSTARAIKRAKEVGLRKVMGAQRPQLMGQFLGETVIVVAFSLVISVLLLEILVPLFNSLMGQSLQIVYLGRGSVLGWLALTGLATALVAGSYPAFYLSSFVPARVLKGQISATGNAGIRKLLTVFQFGVATFLVIGTMIVFRQMNYIQETDLGFDQNRIIYVNPPSAIWKKKDAFKQSLLRNPSVLSVAFSNGTPGMENSHWTYAFPRTDIPQQSINTMIVDYDYIKTYGLEITEGRGLSEEFATDSTQGYLVNESLVRDLLLEQPIGTSVSVVGNDLEGKIIGVVKDFHYRSLHRRIEPLIMRVDPNNMWCLSVKIAGGPLADHLKSIESEWKKFAPDYPFEYQFVDDTIERQYQAEQNTSILITSFSILAIIIACLGLIGLTTFMTEQRKKEIGVRKVLGASVSGIIALLSKDFSKLVLIAFVIVAPLAWYVMNQWLQDFAYKVAIPLYLYLVAGLLVIIISFLSVFYQAMKAALINPSETLRSE